MLECPESAAPLVEVEAAQAAALKVTAWLKHERLARQRELLGRDSTCAGADLAGGHDDGDKRSALGIDANGGGRHGSDAETSGKDRDSAEPKNSIDAEGSNNAMNSIDSNNRAGIKASQGV